MTDTPPNQHASGTRDWLAARHPWTKGSVLEGVVVGVLAAGLSVVLRTEIVASDPWGYVNAAINFPDDRWVPLGYTRYGMILPRVPIAGIFGNSEITHYFWPILSSATLCACMYLISNRFWGRIAATLAFVLTLSSSVTFINLSRGYPDIQSIAIISMAVVVALNIRDQLLASRTNSFIRFFICGSLLGWAFETRETTLLVWPVIALILYVKPIRLRLIAGFAVGLLTWVVADVAIGTFAYGDPLIRLHVLTGQDLASTTVEADLAARAELVGRPRLFYFLFVPKMLFGNTAGAVTVCIMALASVGIAFKGGSRLVSFWFLLSYVTFVGITGGLSPDHPSGRIDIQRYWVCFLPVAALAAAGCTAEIASKLTTLQESKYHGTTRLTERGFMLALALIVGIGPFATTLRFASSSPQLIANGADQLAQMRTYMEVSQPEGGRVVTDFASTRIMAIYQRGPFGGRELWSARIVNIEAKGAPRSGDLVAVNSLHNQSCFFCYNWINEWVSESGPIPRDWHVIWVSNPENLVLYEVP